MTPPRRFRRSQTTRRIRALVVAMLANLSMAAGADEIRAGYIQQARQLPPALSNLDTPPADEGLAGARLAIADNNTSGRFTGQSFALETRHIAAGADAGPALQSLAAKGVHFVLLDLDAATLGRLLREPLPPQLLLFNVAAEDRRFRDTDCHPALLHTALSRDMRSDALAQFLVARRWPDWLLVTGPRDEDRMFAAAVERSARKFGARIVARKDWTGEFDARRSAQREVPLFTRGPDYDVLVVADELGDFGDYLLFNTHDPRPVAGTQGLVPQTWGRPVEQWGAAQLQERFVAQASRWMLPRDYAAWAAVRSIGEAALRAGSADHAEIEAYLRSAEFRLAGFKGRKMNYRAWNGQLRQPVLLLWARAVVAQAPIEGFLHQHSELDTLGIDRPESQCKLKRE
jgi:ABC transporter substrate binding protein (PQQ-dependent alcohol dehydrogenase system)